MKTDRHTTRSVHHFVAIAPTLATV